MKSNAIKLIFQTAANLMITTRAVNRNRVILNLGVIFSASGDSVVVDIAWPSNRIKWSVFYNSLTL